MAFWRSLIVILNTHVAICMVDYERGIHWNDESLGIDWPLEGHSPLLSSKDSGARMLHSMTEELDWPHEAYLN